MSVFEFNNVGALDGLRSSRLGDLGLGNDRRGGGRQEGQEPRGPNHVADVWC